MSHPTALLIVTMLLGSPVFSSACVLWCAGSMEDHDSVRCHQGLVAWSEHHTLTSTESCNTSATTAFLSEARETNWRGLANALFTAPRSDEYAAPSSRRRPRNTSLTVRSFAVVLRI